MQFDWPWKFWGYRVFHYSLVRVVLPPWVIKWPNLHPSESPIQILTFSPWKPYSPYCYLKWDIKVWKLKIVIKFSTTKLANFSRESRKNSACGVHFYKDLQFITMKVTYRQKTFIPPIKFWKSSLQLVVSVEAYLYAKNLTCCFESLWRHLSTSTCNDWINLLLLLISYHMQKTNSITQLILEIKLTQYLSSLWACSDMPDHIHLKRPTNICCFHGPLVI